MLFARIVCKTEKPEGLFLERSVKEMCLIWYLSIDGNLNPSLWVAGLPSRGCVRVPEC